MNLGIVVLTFNDAENTLQCINSVLNATRPPGVQVYICVVDNGSTGQVFEQLLQQLPETVQLLPLPRNLGYSGGMNAGVHSLLKRHAIDYVWLLNNDCLLQQNAIESLLVGLTASPAVKIAAPTQIDEQGNLLVAGGCHYYPKLGLAKNSKEPDANLDYLHGAAMLLSTEFYQEIGGLDTSYFLYYEELQLAEQCYPEERLYLPDVVVIHCGNGTAHRDDSLRRFTTYHAMRSALIYTRRYHRRWLWSVVLVRVIGHTVLGLFNRHRRLTTGSVWRALKDFCRGNTP